MSSKQDSGSASRLSASASARSETWHLFGVTLQYNDRAYEALGANESDEYVEAVAPDADRAVDRAADSVRFGVEDVRTRPEKLDGVKVEVETHWFYQHRNTTESTTDEWQDSFRVWASEDEAHEAMSEAVGDVDELESRVVSEEVRVDE